MNMSISPFARYYLRKLLLAQPALQDKGRNCRNNGEESADAYLKLEHLTHPQINELEFLAELHQKLKNSEPSQSEQLQKIEDRIFELLGIQLPVSNNALTEMMAFFSQVANTQEGVDSSTKISTKTNKATTLEEYYRYFQTITAVAGRYLGKMIVKNYWLATRPQQSWLAQISVEQFQKPDSLLHSSNQQLTPQQQKILQEWICQFIRQCSRILPILPQLLLAAGVPPYLLCHLVNPTAPKASATERVEVGSSGKEEVALLTPRPLHK
ncbi:hypothetical protein [uncultured Thermosynechococcus sp.]|uniref:hypothetical protein n=1 Tax=uncultured Thermosynechococcus sp. TaxID=436945 RepID=UPI0026166245|nr:hypothetical protein [uncultured Thermosynechococcus sp.]